MELAGEGMITWGEGGGGWRAREEVGRRREWEKEKKVVRGGGMSSLAWKKNVERGWRGWHAMRRRSRKEEGSGNGTNLMMTLF